MELNKNLETWKRVVFSLFCIFFAVALFLYGMTFDLDMMSRRTFRGRISFPLPLILSALLLVAHIMIWKQYIKIHRIMKKLVLWITFFVLSYIVFVFCFYVEVYFLAIILMRLKS